MNTTYNKYHFLTIWTNFWVFLFSISVLAFPIHGGLSAIALMLTMLYLAVTKYDEKNKFALNKQEKIFIFLVILFFSFQLFRIFYQPIGYEYETIRENFSALDNPSRWILLLPVFFLFRRYIVNWQILSIGISIGVFISVAIAHYQVYFLGIRRAESVSSNPIVFGELMVVVDLFLWMFMLHAWESRKKMLSFFLLFSSVVAFYGSLLSVTRGAWLVYIFMILIWLLYILKKGFINIKYWFTKPILFRLFFAGLVFLLVSQTSQYQVMKNRTVNTVDNLSSGNYKSAGGGRVEIYENAIKSIKQYPFGIGTNNYREIKQEGSHFGHAHNEILNVWVEVGIQGVIALLLLIAWVFKLFWKNLKHTNDLISIYSGCGLMLIAAYGVFGQTQVIFNHQQTLIFFIFFLYFFIAQIYRLNGEKI